MPRPIMETGVKTSRSAPPTPPSTKAIGKMPLVVHKVAGRHHGQVDLARDEAHRWHKWRPESDVLPEDEGEEDAEEDGKNDSEENGSSIDLPFDPLLGSDVRPCDFAHNTAFLGFD